MIARVRGPIKTQNWALPELEMSESLCLEGRWGARWRGRFFLTKLGGLDRIYRVEAQTKVGRKAGRGG
jgi:hypothetical protein